MSYFTEFAQLLNEGNAGGALRGIILRIAEILDDQEERIKKLEQEAKKENG